ncbi:MAG TPA: hypothetical protein ENL20_03675 [Candidatus Cloacimonetes bacterium]|nr:hypothetical protein [Candidatus Cloacimonadota bacterium]
MKNIQDFTYQDAMKISYKYALYRTGNVDISKEIASITAGKFVLKKIEGDIRGIKKWITLTSRNFCYEYFRDIKKKKKLKERYKEKLIIDTILEHSKIDTELHASFKKSAGKLNR